MVCGIAFMKISSRSCDFHKFLFSPVDVALSGSRIRKISLYEKTSKKREPQGLSNRYLTIFLHFGFVKLRAAGAAQIAVVPGDAPR